MPVEARVTDLIESTLAYSGAVLAHSSSSARALRDVAFGREAPGGKLPLDPSREMDSVRAPQSGVPQDRANPLFRSGFVLSDPAHEPCFRLDVASTSCLRPDSLRRQPLRKNRVPALIKPTSASTAFRNLQLPSQPAAAVGLGGGDFDYAVTERALDADAGDVNDGDEAATPPEVLAGFSATLGVFSDTVIPPEGRCPNP